MELRSPLVAASGTVGSVWEWADTADESVYGAAVAKSVSVEPWAGRPEPRVAPAGPGMLNGIGIQNPGIEVWLETVAPKLGAIDVPVWGSAVGETPEEFAKVARGLASGGVSAVELNLSCPNLDGDLFALDAKKSAEVVAEVADAVDVPVGAKLSPNAEDVVSVASACLESGADFLTLTNTAWGFGVDIQKGSPSLSGGVGGYSGPGLKAISLRCVYQVAGAFPDASIVGCGGVTSGRDVVEYLMAGATAVGIGTAHFAQPRAGRRILREMKATLKRLGAGDPSVVVGRAL